MKTFSFHNYYRKILKCGHLRRFYSSSEGKENHDINKIRNIGILAHIDAGKTTTTERMLFYSGTIKSMGEVHHGNTVTDFMEQERQRGITITSAAVSLPWRGCQINLVDTPGHIDFTMEVEQGLAVLDGAVLVLDGSAGVEAQTHTVWRQAEAYRVPRLLYVNKMDRPDADAAASARSVRDRLGAAAVLLHAPLRRDGRLVGITDLVSMEEVVWTQGRGVNYTRRPLTERDGRAWEEAAALRRELVDTLTAVDDQLADLVIQAESLDAVAQPALDDALRRCTAEMKAFPVLCGSSYKNIGVQTLMDGIVSYLPSAAGGGELYRCFGPELCARAFKVQHDPQRGALTYLRVYSGALAKGQKIYNLAQDCTELSGGVYEALADEYRAVEAVRAGGVAVVAGYKLTNAGDLVAASGAAAGRARARLADTLRAAAARRRLVLPGVAARLAAGAAAAGAAAAGAGAVEAMGEVELAEALLGIGTPQPEPVFLCSLEAGSAGALPALEVALARLAREDRSLRVRTDPESGQLVLAGMGELHLEVIKERLVREYGLDVELGPLQIAYREALQGSAKHSLQVDRKIGSTRQTVSLTLSARPMPGLAEDKVLRLDKSPESAANLSHIHPRVLSAVRRGAAAALLHGPKLGCKVVDVEVTLHWLEAGRGTADSVVAASVVQCLRKVFAQCESVLLEPVMALSVEAPEPLAPRLLADLGRRRAEILHIEPRRGNKVISCLVPLSELLGYSSELRSLSSGLATFSMQPHSYRAMTPLEEDRAVREQRGY